MAVVRKESLPVSAEISRYEVVSEGDLVGAKIPDGPTDIAQPYSGDCEIILDEEHETKRYLKVRIVKIDESGVFGTVEETKIDLSSDNESTGSRNPFKGGNSSKNGLISGKL